MLDWYLLSAYLLNSVFFSYCGSKEAKSVGFKCMKASHCWFGIEVHAFSGFLHPVGLSAFNPQHGESHLFLLFLALFAPCTFEITNSGVWETMLRDFFFFNPSNYTMLHSCIIDGYIWSTCSSQNACCYILNIDLSIWHSKKLPSVYSTCAFLHLTME